MEIITVIIIAFSLAMDAFAVSVAAGAAYKNLKQFHLLRMAVFFGFFQAAMPVIGHLTGLAFKSVIVRYDHWIAFALLAGIGIKMIHDAHRHEEEEPPNPAGLIVLITLALATSIDALAVGITLNLITDHIILAVLAIGIITFLLSVIGCEAGKKIGHIFENKIEIAAGCVLIGLGLKILIQHLAS